MDINTSIDVIKSNVICLLGSELERTALKTVLTHVGKQQCTQCETLKVEVERLKGENEKLKGAKENKKPCTDCEGTGRFINSKGKETVMYCHKCNGSGEVAK